MTFIQEASEYLQSHGFERGHTVNTQDWWIKKSQEIRLHEKYFSHHRNRLGVLVGQGYLKADMEILENVIFSNYLNLEFARRLYSVPMVRFAVKRIKKRRAKRVENFVKVA
jgi:ABC-type transporter Mla maintaining outer membrane lipid asymmetry ATPase subunit MlaF